MNIKNFIKHHIRFAVCEDRSFLPDLFLIASAYDLSKFKATERRKLWHSHKLGGEHPRKWPMSHVVVVNMNDQDKEFFDEHVDRFKVDFDAPDYTVWLFNDKQFKQYIYETRRKVKGNLQQIRTRRG